MHIVIVGGGPTGVEFGAEIRDFVRADVARLYKKEAGLIKVTSFSFSCLCPLCSASRIPFQVTLIEPQHILQSFDARLQSFAERKIRERKNFHLLQDSVSEVRGKKPGELY